MKVVADEGREVHKTISKERNRIPTAWHGLWRSAGIKCRVLQ